MNNKIEIKNDIMTLGEFSQFLEFALKEQPQHQRIQVKMDMRVLGTAIQRLNIFQQLFNKFKKNV